MKIKFLLAAFLVASALSLSLMANAGNSGKDAAKDSPAPTVSAEQSAQNEGEKRFRSNCGRCHAAPPKFAPRMMATIVRHMRVRATITDQDMHLILRYMTE
jgi:cytochrome c5